ncbi:MAG: hypothetical protein CMH46_00270 [Muricauda sp.]|nr:hypothetical protein [Allomuricauda sp.]MAU13957.1 hypothetical protein [Allomuricauda sp.]
MSDIIRSKPEILHGHVMELRDLCYRVKHIEEERVLNDENYMLSACKVMEHLVKSLHLQMEKDKNASVLEQIKRSTACFETNILGTNTISEDKSQATLEQLITYIESIKTRMQQHEPYCIIL